MFQEYDRLCCLLCTAWTAVHAVSTKPCSMQQDKRSTLCALCMKTSMVSSWRVPCIWTSGTDNVVNSVRHVVHDPGALHGHDCGISGGPAIYVGLVLPSVSEFGDTEETSLVNGSNDWSH